MAEDSGQERSEEPTGKRLLEARRKGQTARSRELNTFVVLVVGSAGILVLGPAVAGKLWQLMRGQFQINQSPRMMVTTKPTAKTLSCGAARVATPNPILTSNKPNTTGSASSIPPAKT